MKVINEKTLYEFKELDNDAKERAIKHYLESADHLVYDFSDSVVCDLDFLYGLSNLKPYFSLSYSRGDGLCLYGHITSDEIFYNENFSNIALAGIDPKDIELIKSDDITITFTHSGRYYYPESVDIDCSDYYSDNDKIIRFIINNIEKWYLDVCTTFEKQGYSFFYEIKESHFQEICDDHDWWFEKNGTIYFG